MNLNFLTKIIATSILTLSVNALAGTKPPPGNNNSKPGESTPSIDLGYYPLKCWITSNKDVAKTVNIENSTNKIFPILGKIVWRASDNDTGQIILNSPLNPGEIIKRPEDWGTSNNCSAAYVGTTQPHPGLKKRHF